MKNKSPRFWILLCAVLLALGAALIAAWQAGWFSIFSDPVRLRATVEQAGPWAPAVFFLLQFAQVLAAPIPGNVTTLVGGALFGLGKSFIISVLAVISGSCVAFLLARKYGMALVRRFVSAAVIDKYMDMLRGRSTLILGLMFLFPVFPDDMLCFLAGLSPIRFPAFLLLAILTRPWGLLGSSIIGSGTWQLPWWAWVLLAAVAAAAFYLSARYGDVIEDRMTQWIRRRFSGRRREP